MALIDKNEGLVSRALDLMSMWWDPLQWALLLKGWKLKTMGFRRLHQKIGSDRFAWYLKEGKGEHPVCLILIHGIALFPEWWKPLLSVLPENYTVCVPELLGFGRSPGRKLDPSSFNMNLYRQQILSIRAAVNPKSLILSGVSLGGWVCLDFALKHPESVNSLILIGPGGANLEVNEEDLMELKKIFDYEDAQGFLRLVNDYVLSKPVKIPKWVGALAVRRSKWNGHKQLINNLTFEDWIGDRAKNIKSRTALIWGKEDKVFPVTVGEDLVEIMDDARLFTLDGVGHSYLFEKPKATNQGFLKALSWIENQ